MRILADEDVYGITVRWLRGRGDDVVAVFESDRRGTPDEGRWEWAAADSRILVTRDKAFGRRFLAEPTTGLIILRGEFLEMNAIHVTLTRVFDLQTAEALSTAMVVVNPTGYRLRPRRF